MVTVTREHISDTYVDEVGIKDIDSTNRVTFSTGATRDIQKGKGRCDLLPLGVVANLLDKRSGTNVYVPALVNDIQRFLYTQDTSILYDVVNKFIDGQWESDVCSAILDLSIHYEEGALKYGERNWEIGIPMHSYIDSGVRHLLKIERGDTDENHVRAFLWNMLGAIWTMENRPEMDDLFTYDIVADEDDKPANQKELIADPPDAVKPVNEGILENEDDTAVGSSPNSGAHWEDFFEEGDTGESMRANFYTDDVPVDMGASPYSSYSTSK